MSPTALLALFDQDRLDPATFHHRDHVALAWALLQREPPLMAVDALGQGLRRMAQRAGHPEAYHETITWAFLLLIRERMNRAPGESWDSFEAQNPDLFTRKPSVLERYYRPETLQSTQARQFFVLPDRLENQATA